MQAHPDLSHALAAATDVASVTAEDEREVFEALESVHKCDRALHLTLILLDGTAHRSARAYAVIDLNPLLSDPQVERFIQNRMYVAPLPSTADLHGALDLSRFDNSPELHGLLRALGADQQEIERCRSLWDALPTDLFGDAEVKNLMTIAIANSGGFRVLVKSGGRDIATVLEQLHGLSEYWTQFDDIVTMWASRCEVSAEKSRDSDDFATPIALQPRTSTLTVHEQSVGVYRCHFDRGDESLGADWSMHADASMLYRLQTRFLRAVRDSDDEAIVSIGRNLYETLLPPADGALISLRHDMNELEVPLIVQSAELDLPWELLHDGVAFLGLKRPIARRVQGSRRVAQGDVWRRRGRCLMIVVGGLATTTTGESARGVTEAERLRDSLRTRGIVCDYLDASDASLRQVLRHLWSNDYDVIHYWGVTSGAGVLRLSGADVLSAAVIESSRSAGLVFLNTCSAGTAGAKSEDVKPLMQAFIAAGASSVVGSVTLTTAETGWTFADRFYDGLLIGQTVGDAMRYARRSIHYSSGGFGVLACFVMYGDPAARLSGMVPLLTVRDESATDRGILANVADLRPLDETCRTYLAEFLRHKGDWRPAEVSVKARLLSARTGERGAKATLWDRWFSSRSRKTSGASLVQREIRNANTVMILGTPGSGKSYLLNELAVQIAKTELDRASLRPLLPVCVSAAEAEQRGRLFQAIHERVARFAPDAPLLECLKAGRLICFIDALDELSPSTYVSMWREIGD